MGNGSGCKTWDMRYAESQQRTAAMFRFMQKENAKYKWYQVPPCPQPRPKDEVELGGVPVWGCFEDHGSFSPGTVFEREVKIKGETKVLRYVAKNSNIFAPIESVGEIVEEDKAIVCALENGLAEQNWYYHVNNLSPRNDRITTPVYSNSYWRRLWWRFLNPFQRFRWAFQNPDIHLSSDFAPVILVYIASMVISTIFYARWACYIFFTAWFFLQLMGAYGGGCDEYPFQ